MNQPTALAKPNAGRPSGDDVEWNAFPTATTTTIPATATEATKAAQRELLLDPRAPCQQQPHEHDMHRPSAGTSIHGDAGQYHGVSHGPI